jgi:hypothetical protein
VFLTVFCLGDYDLGYVLGLYWREYGYDSDIYYGTGGNNMATISNGWFEINYLWKCWFCRGEIQLYKPMPLFMMGVNECLIRAVFARRGVGACSTGNI